MGSVTNFLREVLKLFHPSEEKEIFEGLLDAVDAFSNNKNDQETDEYEDDEEYEEEYDKDEEEEEYDDEEASALDCLIEAAEQGNAEAQFRLGRHYDGVLGVEHDDAEAMKWYRKAAEQGHAGAQYYLGRCYEFGYGVAEDTAETVKWWKKAAEQGYAEAQYQLGYCYEEGDYVTQDHAEAMRWYSKAAEQYRKAAEQGDVEAQYNLGVCYENGLGVAQDYAEAAKWFRKAAEQGDVYAQLRLGEYYEKGEGVSQDFTEAVNLYRKAAEQGYAEAQCNMGKCYERGAGVVQNLEQAIEWYQKAAEQGDADAQQALDRLYDEGKIARKEPSKTPTSSSSQMEEPQTQSSQQTQSELWPTETPKSTSSNTAIIVVCLVLLLICGGVGGYFCYNNVYLPKKLEREAPRYYTFGNLMLRSSQIAGVDYNKIAMLPYGTKFITYSHGAEWSKVKVESADPEAIPLEGYVATPYILNTQDFFLLNSIFADTDSRDAIPTAKCKLALLWYYKEHKYIGDLSATMLEEIGLDITPTSANQWQVFVNAIGNNPCEVYYKKLVNKNSKYNDFAVIIKNIRSGSRKLLYFYFDDNENFHFYAEQDAPTTGSIKNITIGYGGELNVEYTYNHNHYYDDDSDLY